MPYGSGTSVYILVVTKACDLESDTGKVRTWHDSEILPFGHLDDMQRHASELISKYAQVDLEPEDLTTIKHLRMGGLHDLVVEQWETFSKSMKYRGLLKLKIKYDDRPQLLL